MRLYYFVPKSYGLENLRLGRVKLARYSRLNDPFEFFGAILTDPINRAAAKRTIARLDQMHGLLCTSKSWRSPVMWGHYASSHSGFCFGLEVDDPKMASHIRYVPSRLAWREPDNDFLQDIMLTKHVHWSYEDEVRLQVSLEDPSEELQFLDIAGSGIKLAELILGCRNDLSEEVISSAISKFPELDVFKVRPSFRCFDMVRDRSWRFPNQDVT